MSDLGDMMGYAIALQMLAICAVAGLVSFGLGCVVFWLFGGA